MSSRYAQVDRCVWVDTKFLSLSAPPPNAQTLFMWLLTSPESGIVPGLVRIGLAGMAEAIGWPTDATSTHMDELVAAGMVKVDWKARLVWLPKALSRNMPRQHQNMAPWAKAWSEIPECALKADAWQGMFATLESAKVELAESFAKLCPHPLVSVPRGSVSGSQKAKGGAKPTPMPHEPSTTEGGANPATHKQDHNQNQEQKQKQDRANPTPAAAPRVQCDQASHAGAAVGMGKPEQAILDGLAKWPALLPLATPEMVRQIRATAAPAGWSSEDILAGIAELGPKHGLSAGASGTLEPGKLATKLAGFIQSAHLFRRSGGKEAPAAHGGYPGRPPTVEAPSLASQMPFTRAPREAS